MSRLEFQPTDHLTTPEGPKSIPVPFYLEAAATELLDAEGRLYAGISSTAADMVLGSLLEAGSLTRAQIKQWLGHRFNVPSNDRRLVHNNFEPARRVLARYPQLVNQEKGRFTLHLEALPEPTPEMVQDIVHLAGVRWLALVNAERREETLSTLTETLKLSPLEAEMLEAVLLRSGEIYYKDSRTPATQKARVDALCLLGHKLRAHFGEDMLVFTQQYNVSAAPALLALARGISLPTLREAHEARFGSHLPIAQLLQGRSPKPDEKESSEERFQRQAARLKALEAATHHLKATYPTDADMQPLLEELESAAQRIRRTARLKRSVGGREVVHRLGDARNVVAREPERTIRVHREPNGGHPETLETYAARVAAAHSAPTQNNGTVEPDVRVEPPVGQPGNVVLRRKRAPSPTLS